MNLNALAAEVHLANQKWWQDIDTGQPIKRNKGELLALVHSEVSEGYDGQRSDQMDDKLPHRKMLEVELVDAVIRLFDYAAGFKHDLDVAGRDHRVHEFDSLNNIRIKDDPDIGFSEIHARISHVLELERKAKPSSEVATAILSVLSAIFSMAAAHAFDLQGAFDEKMAYNAQREDHKHEARRIAGGKQF